MDIDVPEVVALRTGRDFLSAAQLYRTVFGYKDPNFTVNPLLVQALRRNGGSALGAWHGERLVAFTYGFSGLSAGMSYHYSQAAVVHPEYRSVGLGKRLKFAQREAALATGATHMRWAFDPAEARNAHFNLNSLHAVGRWFIEDFYGDVVHKSDRIVVDWNLLGDIASGPDTSIDVIPPSATIGHPFEGKDGIVHVMIPSSRVDRTTRVRLSLTLSELFSRGYVAVSCDRHNDVAVYCLLPAELVDVS